MVFRRVHQGRHSEGRPVAYNDDKGGSDCELIFRPPTTATTTVYGLVREMIPLQDEINKRRSKSLHLLNVASDDLRRRRGRQHRGVPPREGQA
jgi:hypothetical protein